MDEVEERSNVGEDLKDSQTPLSSSGHQHTCTGGVVWLQTGQIGICPVCPANTPRQETAVTVTALVRLGSLRGKSWSSHHGGDVDLVGFKWAHFFPQQGDISQDHRGAQVEECRQAVISKVLDTNTTRSHGQRLRLGPTHLGPSLTAAAQPGLLLWHPAMKTIIQTKVMTKQKTETNITQPRGLGGLTWVEATRIHTRPPNTWKTELVRKANTVARNRRKFQTKRVKAEKSGRWILVEGFPLPGWSTGFLAAFPAITLALIEHPTHALAKS